MAVDIPGLTEHQLASQHLQEEAEGWGQLPAPVSTLQTFGGDLGHVRADHIIDRRHGCEVQCGAAVK